MITWYDRLLVHNTIDDIEDIKNKISNKEYPFGIYCIIDSLNENNLFEIVSLNELFNVFYKEKNIIVFGIAKGRKHIREVLLNIVESIINRDGMIDKSMLYMQGSDGMEGY